MKISQKDIITVERETAVIKQYPFPTKALSITNIKVNGRHPADTTRQHVEHTLTLLCYVISGKGIFVIDGKTYSVTNGDALFIQPNQKYYIEGILEYLVCCEPAYYRKQHEQVKV